MLKKISAVVVTVIVLATSLANADEPRPLPDSLLEFFPAEVKDLAEARMQLTNKETEVLVEALSLQENPRRYLLRQYIYHSLRSRPGTEEVISVLATTESEDVKVEIAAILADWGTNYGPIDPYTRFGRTPPFSDAHMLARKIYLAMEQALSSANSPKGIDSIANSLDRFHRRRFLTTIMIAIENAVETGDLEGADTLRQRYQRLLFEGSLPDFYYRSLPSLSVDVPENRPVRVLAFGDFGTGDERQAQAAEAMHRHHSTNPFHFGITLGDNFLPSGINDPDDARWTTLWEEPYGELNIPFFASLGNHDFHDFGSPQAEIAYSSKSPTWNLPAPNYSFRAGHAEFFVLETNVLFDTQIAWLEQSLRNSSATWKIVYGHHPIYSSARSGNVEPNNLIDRLLPVLVENGANMYLNGHDHAFEEWSSQGGVRLFTLGTGGSPLTNIEPDQRALFRTNEHGFSVIEYDEESLTITFRDVNGYDVYRQEITRTEPE